MARTQSSFICEQAQKRRIVEEEDVISQLPDDILVAILSLLSFVEAATTCVLSKRWKSLWTHLKVLNFEFPKMLEEPIEIAKSMSVARAKFVGWVNHALQLHQGPVVNEFKLHFFFTRKTFCQHIDKWFNFAIRKSVQRLEVNLSPTRPVPPRSKAEHYFFPNKFFDLIKSPYGLYRIKSLTHLSLTFVHVTGELVEHLLSNCPLLLRLSVSDSPSLVNLNVSGPSLCLNFLEIKSCVCLQSIDIYAPCLASFICMGMTRVLVRLRHAPSLVCLTLDHREGVLTAFPAISSYFSQLESLTLDICFPSAPPPLPELTNLKNLTLQGVTWMGCSLLGWASLIERCPCLHTFTLQMSRFKIKKEVSRSAERLHKCLKVVIFVSSIDVELALHFVQNALALEKIIVVVPPWFKANDWLELLEHAKKLKKKLPPEVKLVIGPVPHLIKSRVDFIKTIFQVLIDKINS